LLARGVREDFGSFFIHSFTFLVCDEKFVCVIMFISFSIFIKNLNRKLQILLNLLLNIFFNILVIFYLHYRKILLRKNRCLADINHTQHK